MDHSSNADIEKSQMRGLGCLIRMPTEHLPGELFRKTQDMCERSLSSGSPSKSWKK